MPPRQSSLPAVIGACVCAAVGFGLVWALGIGRAQRPHDDLGEATVASAVDNGASRPRPDARSSNPLGEPGMLPPTDDALPAQETSPADRWRARPVGHEPDPRDAPVGDQYPERPASLELPDTVIPVSAESLPEPQRVSRFSSPDLPPADEAAATADAAPPPDPAIDMPTTVAPVDAGGSPRESLAAAERAAGSPGTVPAADMPSDSPSLDLPPGAAPRTLAPPSAASERALPEDPGDFAAAPEPPLPPATLPAASAAPRLAPAAFPPLPPTPAPQSAAPAHPDVPGAAAFGAAPPAFVPPSGPPAPFPPPLPPAGALPPAVISATAAAMPSDADFSQTQPLPPFASAPPVMADGIGDADPEHVPSASPPPARPQLVAGQGRPGPLQLEGIQTPQVSVEKRGPREISVGKPVRYEIIVRNIGSATAHDVVLRDAVPQGTALVTTTPPASPLSQASGDDEAALVWSLGTLSPGGQATVTMEVMPQVEGEIGSVASVSFRADASVRSRATKPDLQIECAPPAPVLIGRDVQVTLTITNPGTGVATGVVLEGFLPENVSHRSGRELEFDVGQLRPGESRTIDLVLGTRGPGVHAARLAARADGGVEVTQQLPIEVTAPTLELAVDMPLRRFLQRPATCTISMVNAGTAPARSVELAAQLPPGMKFVKANNAGWHDDRTHRVLWNLEELPPGETGMVEVVVMPVELGPQKIVLAARSADGLADQVSHTCDVEGLAALSFEVVDSEDPIEVDGVTEYVVRVGNQGTKPATGVRLVATLLGDLEPVEAQGPGGHRFENLTVAFEPLAKLAPAEEAVFRVRARGRRAGDQRIQVQLTSADNAAPITKEEVTRVYDDR